jgi:hypothetical protein
MDWNVSREMVDELLAAGVPGLTTRLQAMLVFQHCSVHSLSLFDFLAQWKIEGLRLVPAVDPPKSVQSSLLGDMIDELGKMVAGPEAAVSLPAAAAFVEEEFPDERTGKIAGSNEEMLAEMSYRHSDWRAETLAARRLEKLRLHMAEVQPLAEQYSVSAAYLQQLKGMESSLARVVEPVPTLGMVADEVEAEVEEPTAETLDDIESELEGVAAQPREEHVDFSQSDEPVESLPVIAPASKAEQDDIAAVLANPKAAKPVESLEPRKDSAGRVLASNSRLEEIYTLAEKLGMNRVQAQEFICEKNKLRKVDDLPEAIAAKIVDKMRQRISPA